MHQVEGFQAHETSCTVLFGGTDKYASPSQEDICKDLEGNDDKVSGGGGGRCEKLQPRPSHAKKKMRLRPPAAGFATAALGTRGGSGQQLKAPALCVFLF
jgi:hypothetical protein